MTERIISVLGSGEFLPWSVEVDRYALEAATAGDGTVVVIPTASATEGRDVFDGWARRGLEHYAAMGVDARVSGLRFRADAFDEGVIAQLEGASMYYLSGGDPAYLADTLRGTPFWDALVRAADAGAALAGCSAGACVIGELAPRSSRQTPNPERWATRGLRLLPGTAFGPHWNMIETWMPGAESFILSSIPEGCRLVTLDENTAIVGKGLRWRVFGEGEVSIHLDGTRSGPFRTGDIVGL